MGQREGGRVLSLAPFPNVIALRAGPLEMEFEPASGLLRRVRLGTHELIRAIYSANRDPNWGTRRQEIQQLETAILPDSFTVQWLSTDEVSETLGEISGSAEGRINFEVRITALETFQSMRSGICMLHPAFECQGLPCTIEHEDGSKEPSRFPERIAPHQPFFRIRAIEHPGPQNSTLRTEFAGEIFETEDQRNWTDASFKTYCRPLELPAPFLIRAGEQIEQSVSVSLNGFVPGFSSSYPSEATISFSQNPDSVIPQLGTMLWRGMDLSLDQKDRLKSLQFAHLGLKIDLRRDEDASLVWRAAALGLPIELHFVGFRDKPQTLERMIRRIGDIDIARILLVSESPQGSYRRSVETIRQAIRHDVPILAASGSNFTELNRGWPEPGGLAGVGFALNPQVHAFDDVSLMETTEMHRVLVEQAKASIDSKFVAVSPITLEPEAWLDLPSDTRLHEDFGASWTLASLASLARGKADSVTFFETHGPRGILSDDGIAQRSIERLFRGLANYQGINVREIRCDLPFCAHGVVLDSEQGPLALIANLTNRKLYPHIASRRQELGPYETKFLELGGVPTCASAW
jgi:hypothetical protein